ncbi:MAG: hypothetical protein DWQ08_10815 [Proteobacteria bacterium]|nr:MAG: hypothetical protein DWQ08_10815 [Pseudomonadota bacterium]
MFCDSHGADNRDERRFFVERSQILETFHRNRRTTVAAMKARELAGEARGHGVRKSLRAIEVALPADAATWRKASSLSMPRHGAGRD